jgi:hypothetical protein
VAGVALPGRALSAALTDGPGTFTATASAKRPPLISAQTWPRHARAFPADAVAAAARAALRAEESARWRAARPTAQARRAPQFAFGGAGGHRSGSCRRGNTDAGLEKRTL